MMPTSTEFALNKITLTVTLEDGTEEILETRVCEREKAKQVYDDAVASGKTAVLGTADNKVPFLHQKPMFRLFIGNLPPHSRALLQVFCS